MMTHAEALSLLLAPVVTDSDIAVIEAYLDARGCWVKSVVAERLDASQIAAILVRHREIAAVLHRLGEQLHVQFDGVARCRTLAGHLMNSLPQRISRHG